MSTDLTIKIPSYQAMVEPALRALRSLGGSATKGAIYDQLVAQEGWSDVQCSRLNSKGTEGEIRSRLSWALSDLKNVGALVRGDGKAEWHTTELGDTIPAPDLIASFKAYRRERMERAAGKQPVVAPAPAPAPEPVASSSRITWDSIKDTVRRREAREAAS